MSLVINNSGTILNPKNIINEGRQFLFGARGFTGFDDFGYIYNAVPATASTKTDFKGNRDGDNVTVFTTIADKVFTLDFGSVSAVSDPKLQGYHLGAQGVAGAISGTTIYGIDVSTVIGRSIYIGKANNGFANVYYVPNSEISGNGRGQEQNQDMLNYQAKGLALPTGYVPSTALLATGAVTTPFGVFVTLTDWRSQLSPLLDAIADDFNPAAAPTAFAATKTGANINLGWTAPAGTLTGYIVERQLGAGAFIQIATPAAGATTYVDVAPANGTYTYRLKALNIAGASSGVLAGPVTLP